MIHCIPAECITKVKLGSCDMQADNGKCTKAEHPVQMCACTLNAHCNAASGVAWMGLSIAMVVTYELRL